MSSDDIEKCKQERGTLFEKYYETLLLTLGMRYYLDKNGRDCHFISAEQIFRNGNGEQVKPDIVFQYEPLDKGALCEIKTSLPIDENQLLDKLKQLEKYCQDLTGWETPNKRVTNHDVLFFCHQLDYDRVVPLLVAWIQQGKLKMDRNLVVCEWDIIASPKAGRDELFVRKRYGDTNCVELNQMLTKNIRVSIDRLSVDVENCKFTRKEPPEEYTMVQLWMNIFPYIHRKLEDFEVSTKKILEVAYEYYIPWSNIGNEFSQVRETWIKKAMKKFCEIKLAKKIESEEGYTVFRSKRLGTRDAKGYFMASLCGETVSTEPKPKVTVSEKALKGQKRMVDFFKAEDNTTP